MRFLGIYVTLTSWAIAAILLIRWRDKTLPTISKHAASHKTAQAIFASSLVILGSAFFVWMRQWFIPTLQLGVIFETLLATMLICLLVAAIVPDTRGWRHRVHWRSAYAMAILFLPLGFLAIASGQISTAQRIIGALLLAYMAIGFLLVAVLGMAKHRYLFFQGTYIAAFQLIILLAAYA